MSSLHIQRARILCLFLVLFMLCIPCISFGADASGKFEITVDAKLRRVSVKAENAGMREVLAQIAAKTGMHVEVLEGVPDRKISMDMKDVPYLAISSLLEKMGVKNYGVGYERETGRQYVYVVNAGNELPELLKGKTVVKPGNFASGKGISRVKGKEIVTETNAQKGYSVGYIKDEVLLKFHLGVTQKEIDGILKKHNLVASADNGLSKVGYVKVIIPDGRSVKEVSQAIAKEYKLKVPEPNYIQLVLTVNDLLYENQWYVQETKFDLAWDKLKSKETVKVAVIDTGVQADHPDLQGKILKGYDFISGKEAVSDDNGHGTFVAGIIAGNANNIGIKGLYDYARIIPVKVIDANGVGTYEDAAKGIIFAADSGARVINLSIGGYGFSFLLQDAVDYALEKGCIVVAAGGNDGIERPVYPAAYPDVIGVAALDRDGKIWSGSNSGKHIKVSAPGVDIVSTGLGVEYIYDSGTSASSPMVAALATMLAAERTDLSSSGICRLIMQSAKDLGEKGRDKIYGRGGVDSAKALGRKLKPFHDIAVRGLNIEPLVIEKWKPAYLVAKLQNAGTFQFEKGDVVFYEVTDDVKKEIGRKSAISVIGTTSVSVEWYPSRPNGNISFEVSVLSESDSSLVNNVRKTAILSINENDGLYILHKNTPPVHGWIAYQAYKNTQSSNASLYNEMTSYVGPNSDSSLYLSGTWTPASTTQTSNWTNNYDAPYCPTTPCATAVIEGAWEEDEPILQGRWMNHFWNPPGGYNDGLALADSALKKAQETTFANAINNYLSNPPDKNTAYYWLGRTAHLLTDMSVPAHALNDQHATNDSYEDYVAYKIAGQTSENYKKYGSTDAVSISQAYSMSTPSNYDSTLTSLFYGLANQANNWDSDDYNGEVTVGKYRFFDYRVILPRDILNVSSIVWYKQCTNGSITSCQSSQTLTLGTNYEFDIGRHISHLGSEPPAVYLYDNVGSTYDENDVIFESVYDVLKLTYKGTDNVIYSTNYDTLDYYTLDYYDLVPSSVFDGNNSYTCGSISNHCQQKDLEKYAIGNVTALYKLFWDKTHPTINSVTPSPGSVSPGSTISIKYNVTNSGAAHSLILGASLRKSGNTAWDISDAAHDIKVNIPSGTNDVTRQFTLPSNLSPGTYDIYVSLIQDTNGDNIISAGDTKIAEKIVTGVLTVQSQTGTLSVTATQSSGGIYVDGSFKANGSWSGSVATGSHTVSFGSVSGYNTPANQTVTVNSGQTTNVTGTYTTQTGTLSVTTTPVSGAISVDGTFKANGSWSGSVATGSHTVSFGAVSGYNTPVNQTVTVNNGQTTNVTGTYTTQVTPTITVTNPTSGANLTKGQNYTIYWASSNVTGNVQIDLYKGASNFQQLAASDLNDGSYPFTPLTTFPDGSDYRVCISAMSGTVSNCSGYFTISSPATPTITVISPTAGSTLVKEQNYSITWTSSNVAGNVQIDLYKGASNYQQLAASDLNDGIYPFTPLNTFPDGSDYRVCMSAMSGTVSNCSGNFTISSAATPTMTVISPTSSANLTKGQNYTINWTSSNVTGNVQIDLYKGASNYQQLAASDPNDGSYPFTPLTTFPDGSDYRVCISAMSGTVSNCSGNFTISSAANPTLTVTSPTAGATLTKGQSYSINWTSSNVTGNVQIDLYKGASNYQQMAASDPNDGSYPFTPLTTFPDGSDYRVCMSAMSGTVSNCSGNFTITQETGTLYPNVSSPVLAAGAGGQLPRIKKNGNNIYILNNDSSRNLMFYKSTDNGASFASGAILGTPVMNSVEFEFGMDTNGYLYAFWEDQNNDQMYIRRSLDGGTNWSSSAMVASGFTWMDQPSCYYSDGTLYLLFRGFKNSIIELYLTKSTDNGGTFSTPVQVTNNSVQEDNGKIAVHGSNVYVVYYDAYSTNNTYLVASQNSGSSFGSPVQVNRTSGKSDFGPSVAVNGAGNIFVAYKDTTSDGEGDLYVAKSSDGGSTFVSTQAADATYRGQEYPKIFIDANNNVNLLWNDNRDNISYGSVYYTRSIDGGTSYEPNVTIRSSGGISNGSLYVVSDTVSIAVTDYKTSPFSTVFYKLTWQSDSAPTGAISINSGEAYTNSPQVTLTLSASDDIGVTGYYVSENSTTPSASNSGWISITPTASYNVDVSYELSSGNGEKTVYVWFKDAAGNVSSPTSASITVTLSNGVLFSDDFNDNSIDASKWTIYRVNNRVAEEGGVLKLETNVTDQGGAVESQWFVFDPSAPISIKRKVLVHSGGGVVAPHMVILLENYVNSNSGNGLFSIQYANDSYYGNYGISLCKDSQCNPIFGTVSPKLADVIWDDWFDEEIQYSPTTGNVDYFINGTQRGSYNVGTIPPLSSYRMKLYLDGWGWFTGHYQHVDDLVVSQSLSNISVPLMLTLVGSGSGSVHSDPVGISCTTGTCSAPFAPNTPVNLLATPSSDPCSYLNQWTGACNGSGDCSVTMDADKSVTAEFLLIPPLKVVNAFYPTLFAAYQSADEGTNITVLAHETGFSENLTLNRNVAVDIKGGQDCDFGSITGWTTLNGVLTVGKGSLTVDKLIIK